MFGLYLQEGSLSMGTFFQNMDFFKFIRAPLSPLPKWRIQFLVKIAT